MSCACQLALPVCVIVWVCLLTCLYRGTMDGFTISNTYCPPHSHLHTTQSTAIAIMFSSLLLDCPIVILMCFFSQIFACRMMYSTTLFQPHIHLVYITFKYLLNILMPVQYLNLCLSISYFCQQLNDAQIFIKVKTTDVKVVK